MSKNIGILNLNSPDYDFENGRKLLEELPDREGELIRFYVANIYYDITRLKKRISEMQEVFNGIKRFTL